MSVAFVGVLVTFRGLGVGVLRVVKSMYSREGELSFVGWDVLSLRGGEVLIELFVASTCCDSSSIRSLRYLVTVVGSLGERCTCWVVRVR